MSKSNDNIEQEYLDFVTELWVASKFAPTYSVDLIHTLLEAGFIVDGITSSTSGDDCIVWVGTCYDEDMIMYSFTATWTFNMELFTKSERHYYELSDITIEALT